jgi:hypothetical protein
MNILRNDINFGLGQENKIINNINTYFNDNCVKTDEPYAPFDFISDTSLYELKSRRLYYNTYSTTIFPKHKIDTTNNQNKKRILLFSFMDGLYYIEYNKDLFKTFIINKRRYRTDRLYNGKYIDKEVDYFEIPITNLTKIY